MLAFILIGLLLSIAGLGGVLWCLRQAGRLRRGDVPDSQVHAEIGRLAFVHMAAIGAAFLGLGLLVVGVLLA